MKKLLSLLTITLCSLVVIAWCTSKNGVKIWDTVSIAYTATFSDGKAFEEHTEKLPLTFTVGSGQVIQGLEENIIGMQSGDTRTITIAPEKWYGKLYTKNNIQKVSQFIFGKLNIPIEKWITTKLGNIEGIIRWIEQDGEWNNWVFFDINPRQTRDTLRYKVTILTKK